MNFVNVNPEISVTFVYLYIWRILKSILLTLFTTFCHYSTDLSDGTADEPRCFYLRIRARGDKDYDIPTRLSHIWEVKVRT